MTDLPITLLRSQMNMKKYPDICRAIHQENKGHGGAVNTGIKNATGIYLKVVDSDDWVNEYAYGEILDTLANFYKQGTVLDMLLSNYVYEKQGAKKKLLFIIVMQFQKIRSFAGMMLDVSLSASIF